MTGIVAAIGPLESYKRPHVDSLRSLAAELAGWIKQRETPEGRTLYYLERGRPDWCSDVIYNIDLATEMVYDYCLQFASNAADELSDCLEDDSHYQQALDVISQMEGEIATHAHLNFLACSAYHLEYLGRAIHTGYTDNYQLIACAYLEALHDAGYALAAQLRELLSDQSEDERLMEAAEAVYEGVRDELYNHPYAIAYDGEALTDREGVPFTFDLLDTAEAEAVMWQSVEGEDDKKWPFDFCAIRLEAAPHNLSHPQFVPQWVVDDLLAMVTDYLIRSDRPFAVSLALAPDKLSAYTDSLLLSGALSLVRNLGWDDDTILSIAQRIPRALRATLIDEKRRQP